jgi:FkbM family methyltransferase
MAAPDEKGTLPAQIAELVRFLPDWQPFLVIEVGAGTGATLLEIAALHPEAVLHGIEPAPDSYAALAAATHGRANIRLHPVALGSHPGPVMMRAAGTDPDNALAPNAPADTPGLVEVPMTTGAILAAECGIEAISLLRVDATGSELKVLRGFLPLLARTDLVQVTVALNPRESRHAPWRKVDDLLRDAGFDLLRTGAVENERLPNRIRVAHRASPVYINRRLLAG